MQVTNYTAKNGEKRRRYEVVADNVHFVDGSKNNNSGDSGNPFSTPASGGANTGVAYSSGNTEDFEEFAQVVIKEDERDSSEDTRDVTSSERSRSG